MSFYVEKFTPNFLVNKTVEDIMFLIGLAVQHAVFWPTLFKRVPYPQVLQKNP